jgi:predicted enzyme related to lactoylglutathione lyase
VDLPTPLARLDLTTPEPTASAAFLTDLFGWEIGLTLPNGQLVLVHGEQVVASVEPHPPAVVAAGIGAQWLLSIGVPSLDDALAAAVADGGQVAVGAFPTPGGTRAVVVDRVGGVLGLLEPAPTALSFRAPVWAERTTAQVDHVLVWVTAVADWSARPVDDGVHEWNDGDVRKPVAALVHGGPDASERWVPFVAVDGPAGVLDRVRDLGGDVLADRTRRGVLIADPWGAVLGLVDDG